MATYAGSTYGSSTYGPTITNSLLVSGQTATPINFSTIYLVWSNPGSSVWQRLRLVRSQYGYPANQDDGVVLFDLNCGPSADGTYFPVVGPTTTYLDSGLTPGRFYYYSWFVSQTVGNSIQWTKAGDALGQSIKDHQYGTFLINRVPSIFASASGAVEEIPGNVNSALASFLNLIGFDLSRTRDYLDRLSYMTEPEVVHGNLLPQLVQTLGFTYEPMIGMRLNRGLAYDAALIHRQGGTALSVVALAQDVMDAHATILPNINLMLDDNDSSFEQSLGNWQVVTGQATAVQTTTVTLADGTNPSAGALQITANAAGTGAVSTVHIGATYGNGQYGYGNYGEGIGTQAVTNGIPVTENQKYTISAYFRSATATINPTVDVAWYDQTGAWISTSSGSAGSATTTTDWSCRVSVTDVAPPGAAYAAPVLNFNSMTNGSAHYADHVQFEQSASVSAYGPARQIRVDVRANRVNELINGAFDDASVYGWTAINASLSQNVGFPVANGGVNSCQVAPSGAGTSGLKQTITAAPGQTYVAAAQVLSGSSDQTYTLSMQWLDKTGAVIRTDSSSELVTHNISLNNWYRLELASLLVPVNAATGVFTVEVVTAGTATTFYVDDCMLEYLNEARNSGEYGSSTYGNGGPYGGVANTVNWGGSTPYDLGFYGSGPYGGTFVPRFFDPYTDPVDAVWEGTVNRSRLHLYPLMGIRRSRLEDLISKSIPLGASYAVLLAQPRPW